MVPNRKNNIRINFERGPNMAQAFIVTMVTENGKLKGD